MTHDYRETGVNEPLTIDEEAQSHPSGRRTLNRPANTRTRDAHHRPKPMADLVGRSRKMLDLKKMIAHAAGSDITVLITGESGTGKELVADIIHKRSRRSDKTFLKFNCHAVPDNLMKSDLFGYEKGAFTGADARRKGKFEAAHGGTLFLDEIGDISPMMQASLLRVLENGEIVRVGGNETVQVDVRVVAATNAGLAANVEKGTFRRDLFYRLNVFNIHLPPLRERKKDIVPLANHFIRKYCTAFQKGVDGLSASVIERAKAHDWPGNVRELENMVKRAVLLAEGNKITEREMIFDDPVSCPANTLDCLLLEDRLLAQPLKDSMAEMEYRIMAAAAAKYNGNPRTMQRVLGLGKTAFYEKMKRYGLLGRQKKK